MYKKCNQSILIRIKGDIKSGKKLNMGKSCVQFRKLEQSPLDIIRKIVAHTSVDEFIKIYKHARKTYTKKGR
ncbi:MAG: hypothetical protein HGN29_03525 [Asgard group archaeon]|nr:hypothetical protein [Asgard group archaeon]